MVMELKTKVSDAPVTEHLDDISVLKELIGRSVTTRG